MPRYAVKLTELYLVSEEPITPETTVRALRMLMMRKKEPILSLPDASVVIHDPEKIDET